MKVQTLLPRALSENESNEFFNVQEFILLAEEEDSLNDVVTKSYTQGLIKDGMEVSEAIKIAVEETEKMTIQQIRTTAIEILFQVFTTIAEKHGGETVFTFDFLQAETIAEIRFIFMSPIKEGEDMSKFLFL